MWASNKSFRDVFDLVGNSVIHRRRMLKFTDIFTKNRLIKVILFREVIEDKKKYVPAKRFYSEKWQGIGEVQSVKFLNSNGY